ncbi:TPA: hypothetical protein SCR51_005165 [Citrobacter freundii]|uniref:hypothetical protein n=1 Tax=Citrobacter freundii TaxID=546 RepID=UPI0025A888C6|nr:hypothetical protein [Citrobacter freundii]ELK7474951.1 hypothetical protein [Citrobacter freundii]HCB2886800.1 hypothetical protein [Citrobacter freundii]HEG1884703.1 hypothetical protein [Citrobacter freundii]
MTSREKFEQAIKARFGDSIDYRVCKNSDGEYMAWDMQVAWWAWQAAETDLAVQLANAESKCAALAAENAGLKNPDNWLSQSDYGYEASEVATQNGATEDESLRAGMIAIINRIKTPSTDAFLAEVRAQAIESLLTESFRSDIAGALADFDGMDEQSLQTLIWSGQPPEPDGDVWCVEYMSRAAAVLRKVRLFAAQLRQGGAE